MSCTIISVVSDQWSQIYAPLRTHQHTGWLLMRRYKSNCKFFTEMMQIGSFLVSVTIYVLKRINFGFPKKKNGWNVELGQGKTFVWNKVAWVQTTPPPLQFLLRGGGVCRQAKWHKTLRIWGPLEILSIAKLIKIKVPLHHFLNLRLVYIICAFKAKFRFKKIHK